jgi:Protein of unknown function (DUF2490)
MKTKATIPALLLLALPAPASASQDEQIWTTASATVKISDNWRLSQEIVLRMSNARNGLYEVESNTLLGFKLNKVMTIWAGYTHDPQYSNEHFSVMEHRAREQVTFDNFTKLGPGKLSARMRAEQRWRDGKDGTGWRLRPYVKWSVPLNKKMSLNLSNETFVNLNTTSFQARTGIDRMRNLISVSGPLLKNLNGEAGYMNQHGFVKHGEDTSDHIGYFAVSLSI